MPNRFANEERFYNICQKLSDDLHTTTSAIKDVIAQHEARITVLEKSDDQKKSRLGQMEIVPLLLKALVVAVTAIATMAGAGGILAQIFGGLGK